MTELLAPTVLDPDAMPPGDYAIVEVLGHRTLVGRIIEATRFGATLLAVEPLFAQWMLPAVLIGGASIYQLTPCSPKTAWHRRAKYTHELPDSISLVAAEIAGVQPLRGRPLEFIGTSYDGDDA
jgi:hypothetical protein